MNNLSEHNVVCSEDVLALIGRAQERRRVGETRMNKQSSRSHCVFTLSVTTQVPRGPRDGYLAPAATHCAPAVSLVLSEHAAHENCAPTPLCACRVAPTPTGDSADS